MGGGTGGPHFSFGGRGPLAPRRTAPEFTAKYDNETILKISQRDNKLWFKSSVLVVSIIFIFNIICLILCYSNRTDNNKYTSYDIICDLTL